ncbi:MAG: hypothetical protein H6723_19980 [Sandaracinus sp.]|nr:hypothetical protein [Sandaracinus sp.]
MSTLLAAVAVALAVLVVHGAIAVVLHQQASAAAGRGGPAWLPRVPLLSFAVVAVGACVATPWLLRATAPGLLIGGAALATGWLGFGLTLALLIRRRF